MHRVTAEGLLPQPRAHEGARVLQARGIPQEAAAWNRFLPSPRTGRGFHFWL